MAAGVKRYVYRPDASGNVSGQLVDIIPYRNSDTIEPLEKRVQRDLYGLECAHGARFSGIGEYSKRDLKRVWIDNVERDAVIERRQDAALSRLAELTRGSRE